MKNTKINISCFWYWRSENTCVDKRFSPPDRV